MIDRVSLPALLFVAWLLAGSSASADTVRLKNGLIYRGIASRVPGLNNRTAQQNNAGPTVSNPFVMIDDEVRQYFIPWKRVADFKEVDDLAGRVRIKIPQRKTGRTSGPEVIGGFRDVRPFNDTGHGMVTLTVRNKDLAISLGITEISPDAVKVEGLDYSWEFGILPSSLPVETLRSVLELGIDSKNEQDRKAVVLLFIQAQMYPEADAELQNVVGDFPSLKGWADSLRPQIAEGLALKGINEIQRRIGAGQHALAYEYARNFPRDGISAEIVRQADEILINYDAALDSRNRILMRLDELQAKVEPELADRLRPLRSQLADELHYETLPRLATFVRSERDPDLTPKQQLALAYSGWVLGDAAAGLEIQDAVRLWNARFLAMEALRAERNPPRQEELFEELRGIESLTVEKLVQMVPQLPLPFEPVSTEPRTIHDVTITELMNVGAPVKYSVILPPEYSPRHRYPALIVLHDVGKTPEDELRWWAGAGDGGPDGWAVRRGYIVLAPHYFADGETAYSHSPEAHRAIVETLLHARKRFSIDSDRVTIAGHGAGGDAVFDMATAAPDLFAGAVPICGHSYRSSSHLYENAQDIAWYVVSGERESPGVRQDNARDLNRMRVKQDLTICDFKARGYENYREELPRLFDWLETVRRPPLKDRATFEASTLRVTDNEFGWLTCSAFPADILRPPLWDSPGAKITPMAVSGKITAGGTIYVSNPGRRSTLWLTPDLVDLEKRITVHVNTGGRFRDFVKPDVSATLQRLGITGDRERPVWAKIDIQK